MKKSKVLVITPYASLNSLFLNEKDNFTEFDMDIFEGDNVKACEIFNAKKDRSYDVIISRGGTVEVLESLTDIPVIDLGVTAFDMIRVMRLTENFSGKMAVVGSANIAECAKNVSQLLSFNIDIFAYKSYTQVESFITNLSNQNYRLIIGDSATFKMAKKLGMNGVLLSSGPESVKEGLLKAKEIIMRTKLLSQSAAFYKEVLKNSRTFIYVLDEKGSCLFDTAKKCPQEALSLKRYIQHNFESFKNKKTEFSLEADGYIWDVYVYSIDKKNVFEISYAIKKESNPMIVSYKSENDRFNFGVSLWDVLSYSVMEQIKFYSMLKLPVLITGEEGTGKNSAAYEIYKNSSFSDEPFVSVDCDGVSSISIVAFDEILKKLFSRKKGTVYFENVFKLSLEAQKTLYRYISLAKTSENFLILSSAEKTMESYVKEGAVLKKTAKALSELTINLKPLRERKGEIRGISGIMLSNMNIAYGKQIIGFEEKALKKMLEYSWPQNMVQLKNTVNELAAKCGGVYINENDVYQALMHDNEASTAKFAEYINLNGTLDEIISDVINYVVADENMNQSKAAKRLNVGRSTLWRKMKNSH